MKRTCIDNEEYTQSEVWRVPVAAGFITGSKDIVETVDGHPQCSQYVHGRDAEKGPLYG